MSKKKKTYHDLCEHQYIVTDSYNFEDCSTVYKSPWFSDEREMLADKDKMVSDRGWGDRSFYSVTLNRRRIDNK